ncbi:MAG TPA: hypothetical protein VFZ64_06085 [Nocardioidaceae bacterium]
MSAEHRKPVVAFVALAIIAAALVGMQRADARGGEMLAAVIGAGAHVDGTLPERVEVLDDSVVTTLGSALLVLTDAPGAAAGGAGNQAGTTSGPGAAVAGRESARTPREVTRRPGVRKPTSAGARSTGTGKAITPLAAEKEITSVRSNRPRQAPARPRAASTTLRVATATPASTLQRSTTSRVGRAPQARAALASKRFDRPRRAVAPGKRWRSEHRRAMHRSARQARLHHVSRR